MIDTIKKSFYKNGYLLIIAAWLYTISFIFSNYWFYTSSPKRVQKQLEAFIVKSEKRFENFISDSVLLQGISINRYDPKATLNYLTDEIGVFVYTRNDAGHLLLDFWNNNKVLPDNKDLLKPDGKYFVQYANGQFEFIKKTFLFKGQQVIAAAVIPVHWDYFFINNYFRSGFPTLGDVENRYQVVSSHAQLYVKNGDGKVLFGLNEKKKIQDESPGVWSLTLRILAIIFVLIFIHVCAFDIVHKQGWMKGFAFLAGTTFFFRFLSYVFSFPFKFRNLELFDPSIYASNSLHPSLGDLFINVILLFWVISFIKLAAINNLKNADRITGTIGWWLCGLLSVFLIVLSFSSAEVIRSLIVDSQISFDVINFFSLNIYSLLSFIILGLIVLSFFHFSHIALLFISKCVDCPYYAKYLFVAVTGFLYLSLNLNNPTSSSNLIVLLWLLVYMAIMEFRKEDIYVPILRSSFFLIWLIFFAGSISALIIYQNHYKELEQEKQVAEKLAVEADPLAQNVMSIGITNINDDFLTANFNRLTYETSNKIIKDSLINQNFSTFLNRYDTRLYTFDNNYHPLYNEDSVTYGVLTTLIRRSKKTAYADMFYYENAFYSFSFLYEKEIKDSLQNVQGYFFVIAEPKKYKNQALYPELFKQVKDAETDLNLTYAVYNKGELISSAGDYNFLSHIPKNQLLRQEYKEHHKGEFNELWYNAGNNKLVIIVRNASLFIESITLFAYLFGSFLFIIVLFQVGHFLIRFKFSYKRLKNGLKLNIRHQIQSAIIFISIFSFLVIGIATISFYINRFRQTNQERLVKAIKILGDEIETQVANHTIFDDAVEIYELGAGSELEKTFKEIAEIHNVDANFFDINGNLRVSTQPYMYNKGILSRMMDPNAFYRLRFNKEIQVIQEEKVSNFAYLSIYVPIKDENGELYAYLNIPYLNTQKELNQEISNFLVTLIVLNAFIFVIASAISVLLTNRITSSFTLIANKMKDINLGKANEEITWNANDEIGALVNEYNKMVKKLEESALALAKSEREGAWREMARQVAHEIKNPLTPMKLSIQYLERAIKDKSPNMQEMSERVSATLVEQIDQLAKIASDFSQFANIGNVKIEVFDVNEILNSLINLYSTNEKVNITFIHPDQKALISADRTQINRLFTNLFQNAVEASEGQQMIDIVVTEVITANKLQIAITDHGGGISIEKQQKIFTPNFTTKSSGTGLGLAMCKGIVEKANGRIWFDTEEGKGTTFHVLLPLVGFPES
ncbi:MAG: nitrogen regulation protein NtrY [Segetibacter sp.]|nr:nitrogen regulation protein NtrY [Segetibacter sp.]